MSEHQFSGGNIRKLWPTETDKFRDHLLRLDKMSRRLRFAHGVSDAFVEDYAGRTGEMGALMTRDVARWKEVATRINLQLD